MIAHLFTVRQRFGSDLNLDSLITVDAGNELICDPQLFAAAQELSCLPNDVIEEHERVMTYYNSTLLRLRFNSDMYPHILLLKAQSKLSMDELEYYLKTIDQNELIVKLQDMRL
ncbi:hypothetical protein KAU11_09705 [Candidatus Babeliales bacterium]|nr:hypothetical protein [Candidatus Babeliales bacterium]